MTRTHLSDQRASRWAVAGLCLAMLMPSLDTSIANAGLPSLQTAFHASFQAVQWIVLAYLLAITTVIVSAGRLGDLIGRRRLLLVGIALFTAASLACGLAPTLWLLLAARAAQGLGAAVMMSLTLALVSGAVAKTRTGSAMGLMGTMSALGTMLGPSLGGVLMAGAGWRSIFLANVPLGLVTYALVRRYLPVDESTAKAEGQGRFDITGTVLLVATLASYALAMTLTTGAGQLGPLNFVLLLVAIIGLVLFVRSQLATHDPLIQLDMLRMPGLASGLTTTGLVATVMMATLVVGPFYMVQGLGLKVALVGLALSIGPLVAAMAGWPAGRLVDRFGARGMVVAGLVALFVGAAGLAITPRTLGLAGYLFPIGVMTAGYALFQAANTTQVMNPLPQDKRGVVSGLLSLSRNLGLITGASLMAAIFAMGRPVQTLSVSHAQGVATGLHLTFGVAALLIGLALVIVMTTFRRAATAKVMV